MPRGDHPHVGGTAHMAAKADGRPGRAWGRPRVDQPVWP